LFEVVAYFSFNVTCTMQSKFMAQHAVELRNETKSAS